MRTRGCPRKSRLGRSALPLSYVPMSGDDRTRTCNLFINSEVDLAFGTGHPLFSFQIECGTRGKVGPAIRRRVFHFHHLGMRAESRVRTCTPFREPSCKEKNSVPWHRVLIQLSMPPAGWFPRADRRLTRTAGRYRTGVPCLEDRCSAIELQPRGSPRSRTPVFDGFGDRLRPT